MEGPGSSSKSKYSTFDIMATIITVVINIITIMVFKYSPNISDSHFCFLHFTTLVSRSQAKEPVKTPAAEPEVPAVVPVRGEEEQERRVR